MTNLFQKHDVILFQGDSITDCGRNRSDLASLGSGYAMLTAAWLSALCPQKQLTFINRGISGNRVKDLVQRWDRDCLALKPDWVSIMIGINDTWRRYDSHDPTTTAEYEEGYRLILERIKQNLDAKIVLCEPFLLPYPEDRKAWREDLDPKIAVVRKLAQAYDALLVPLDEIFTDAFSPPAPTYWAGDGVHPTLAGHALIAQSWVKYVKV